MTTNEPPRSNFPASLGPGARPLGPGETPGGGLQEIMNTRSQYSIHVDNTSINLDYELKGRRRHFTIPMDNVPIQGWTRSLAWGGTSSAQVTGLMLTDLIRGSENVLGRDLTQAEAEGTAYHSSRRMMQMYTGQLTAIAVGISMAFYGRGRMKFPFMKPKDPINYTNFPNRFLPILKGRPASIMWSITRYNLYIFLSILAINPFAKSIADTRMSVGMYRDPRTHDMTMQMKDGFDRLKANRASSAGPTVQPQNGESRPEYEAMDDMSPTMNAIRKSERTEFSGDDTFRDQSAETGLLTDSAVSQRQTEQSSSNSWSKAQHREVREKLEGRKARRVEKQQQDSGSFFDDASPTAGNESMDTPIRAPQPQTGSAWSRIRRDESQTPSQGSWRTQTPDFETKSDGFSFSNSDTEKRLAKDQAQKDFDALLEKERREGGSDAYVRDMKATEAGEDSTTTESGWSRRRR